ALNNAIAGALPSGTGQAIVLGAMKRLQESAGIVFVIGLVTAAYSGSRLFTTIESTFSVVFRLRARDFIHQNIMAFCMLLLYLVLVPIIVFASIAPSAIVNLVFPDKSAFRTILVYIGGIAAGFLAACLLFGATYVVVPNRPVPWREVWKGTLAAAALLVVYELLFPIYQQVFLKPSNYGSWAGLAIVILVFFYYMGFILLLGAEINSWAQGQRQTAGDIPAILHEVQAHNTTRGAAGPTAGTPQEDVQHHKGAAAMDTPDKAVGHERRDHDTDIRPPKFAEAGDPGPASQRPDTPTEERHTARAEQQTTGKKKVSEQDEGAQGARRPRSEPTGAGSTTSSLAASSREPANATGTRYPSLTAEDRASRKRRTFGSLAVTVGATLASLLLILRRRTTATT
ncbi:MAG TPA: YihY/virulence factor BrkB family protein, partial [Ktedonobacterales bacterium]|nr:YihY/virulence factor BrkB family protein [Ktedonobacterales bacterium]